MFIYGGNEMSLKTIAQLAYITLR